MIKNVFFCVAKAKEDTLNGLFWIIIIETDRLEETFSDLRTMIGNDVNLNCLQVSWRVGSTAAVANILAKYPHWDRPPCHLTIPILARGMSVIPATADHLKPRNWRGNTKVKPVVLLTVWRSGRAMAEEVLPQAAVLFKAMEMEVGSKKVDILSPNGVLLCQCFPRCQ